MKHFVQEPIILRRPIMFLQQLLQASFSSVTVKRVIEEFRVNGDPV